MLENKLRVVFYLDKDDKELLESQSKLLNMTVSNYVRIYVLEKLGKPIFNPPKIDFNTKQYIQHLLSIGNNLNQIARKLNSENQIQIADQKQVLNDLDRLKSHLLEVKSELSNYGK